MSPDLRVLCIEDSEDDVILRYEGDDIVGLTILNASKR